jgi:predicted DNA-binding protein
MATPKSRTTTKKTLTVVNIRLTPQTLQALTKLAEQDRRTLSQYVRIVLEGHVDAKTP